MVSCERRVEEVRVLRQRAISSVFIVVLTLGPAIAGRYIFTLLVAIIFGLLIHEFETMVRRVGHRPLFGFSYAALLVTLGAGVLQIWGRWAETIITAIVVLPLLGIIFRRDHRGALTDWALTIAISLYVALPAVHFILLRDLPGPLFSFLDEIDRTGGWQTHADTLTTLGLGWYLLAQCVTWLTDVGAYIAGRRFGRHKLAPAISPGKSVEGAIGGLVLGALTAMLCVFAFGLPLAPPLAALVGIALSGLGQLGDLAESLLKRQVGVKDSGSLIPGHGGVFDRLDSLLIVATATYYLARAFS
jgi:phosphatidate cytidylyltransferase